MVEADNRGVMGTWSGGGGGRLDRAITSPLGQKIVLVNEKHDGGGNHTLTLYFIFARPAILFPSLSYLLYYTNLMPWLALLLFFQSSYFLFCCTRVFKVPFHVW